MRLPFTTIRLWENDPEPAPAPAQPVAASVAPVVPSGAAGATPVTYRLASPVLTLPTAPGPLFPQHPSYAKKQPTAVVVRDQQVETQPDFGIGGGRRVSEPYGNTLLSFIQAELQLVQNDTDPRLLTVIEHLARTNGDFSQAVDNLVLLGNTPHTIQFDDKVTDEQSRDMLAFLHSRSKHWYNGGINSLRSDLIAQIALTGALSAEMIPNASLDGVQKIVLVHPKSIEFMYNAGTYNYDAYQRQSGTMALQGGIPGLVQLNPFTYKYYALRRFNEKPHGVPPFLSALENTAIEKDMVANFRAVIKKLGAFGFISAVLTPPQKMQGETVQQAEQRAQKMLDDAARELDKGVGNGYAIGWKGQEISVTPSTTSAANAVELMNMNTVLKMSGLKQDPSLLGRAFSTTETMGRVILAKFGAQLTSIQRLVDTFIAQTYWLDLILAGYKLDTVEVESEKPLVGDENRDQTALGLKIANYNNLYEQGVISQTDRAQALGWEKPDNEEGPRTRPTSIQTVEAAEANLDNAKKLADAKVTPGADSKKAMEDDATNPKTTAANSASFALQASTRTAAYELGEEVPVFDYQAGHVHSTFNHQLESLAATGPGGELLSQYLFGYFQATNKVYGKAVRKLTAKVGKALLETPANTPLEAVTDRVLSLLFTNWKTTFSQKQQGVIQTWITDAYRAFRTDKSVFGGGSTINVGGVVKEIPKATFGLRDARTMEYYRKNDSLYLGKFITDPDTKKKITSYIKEQYLTEGLPIGNNKAALDKFQNAFSNVLNLESWKIQRILSTTVNRMKNFAGVSYFADAEVDKFRIIGITDSLQCQHCAAMQGKEFSVTTALSRIDKAVQGEPSAVKADQPFLVAKLSAETVKEKGADELQSLGFDAPPYHPNCRDQAIAVL